jgi:hypothetical protein
MCRTLLTHLFDSRRSQFHSSPSTVMIIGLKSRLSGWLLEPVLVGISEVWKNSFFGGEFPSAEVSLHRIVRDEGHSELLGNSVFYWKQSSTCGKISDCVEIFEWECSRNTRVARQSLMNRTSCISYKVFLCAFQYLENPSAAFGHKQWIFEWQIHSSHLPTLASRRSSRTVCLLGRFRTAAIRPILTAICETI